ncbi:uncharacterized protein LACBIDRAFT_321388 [Laccaria bicolor S238N-H82]|uniref:Predicted protein n=1 Tax=Laccaria bicolor (strain S238N-H82 / ATCC MYA-4686) TaxID=486041 RepID=B0CQ08_LACBS|nr:uncharacterized protein LACBIDRAFT_321388 [Laccaria bicolor S238N-H82]EDR16156.1 predicted protein [Laccaria bicolor S238N-H82]|eukprot:XP_001874364.1 predicted protein [Laccaria bicolor S238N-H82]
MEYPSKLSVFPIEIIEHIIDDLENDIDALTAVSETCHALLPLCRKRLFQSIDLSPRGPSSLKNLSRLLRYNPDIALYIRELKLHLNRSLDNWDPNGPNAYADNILTLSQVQFLQSLQIVGVDETTSYISYASWNALHPSLRKPILELIYSPTLTELNISRFMLPFATFRSCINLSILTIEEMADYKSVDGTVGFLEVPSHPIPQLHSFIVQGVDSHRYASALIHFRGSDGNPTIKFDRLKMLAVYCNYVQDVKVIEDIVKEAGEMERFVYKANTPEGCRGLAGWITVSAFSTLTTLKVVFNMMWFNEHHLQSLCNELDLFPRNNVLEVLDIEMDVPTDLSSPQEQPWGRLDHVLFRNFSRLRRVVVLIFQIGMRLPEIAQRQQFEEATRAQFTWLRENTPVEFDISTNSLKHYIKSLYHYG